MSTASIVPDATLDRCLRPAGIAVIGATARHGAISSRFIEGLRAHAYPGHIAPVNPRYDEVLGLRCYADVQSAAEAAAIDLAVVSLPVAKVLEALEQCHLAGLGGAIVFSSGFGESGEAGLAEQQKLAELAARTGLRLIGPNSPGFINVVDAVCLASLRVSFRDSLRAGGVGIVAQSGGVMGVVMERAFDSGAGISVGVATGNEADIAAADLLPWFARHEATSVVTLYLEGVRKPERLVAGFDALRSAGKPLVVLKAGATVAGARATAAHTGALASSDDVFEALLRRHGVIRVQTFDELIDTAATLERGVAVGGRRVGIITTSGGGGVAATEAAERAGLEIPPLRVATADRLRAVMPDFASVENPADLSGMFMENPESFRRSLEVFAEAGDFDMTVIVFTGQGPDFSQELVDRLIALRGEGTRPPAVYWPAGAMSAPARVRLREEGFDVFEDADRGMRALATRAAVAEFRSAPPLPAVAAPAIPDRRQLLESEALSLLGSAGVPVVRTESCASARDAAAAAERIGRPVAVKAEARDLAHKSDAGAVELAVATPEAAAHAHDRVLAAARAAGASPEGSVVQEMVDDGVQLIVGARVDFQFGGVLVVGSGGVAAELVDDVSRRVLPIHEGEAAQMLRELKLWPLLDGYRGSARADVAAAARAVEALAGLAVALGDRLDAMEVNPLIVHAEGAGATAVDALVLLADSTKHSLG